MKYLAALAVLCLGIAVAQREGVMSRREVPPEKSAAAQPAPAAQTSGPFRNPADSAPRRIVATGFVEGARRAAELTFETPGRISEIHVQEGAAVSRGDLLARVSDEVSRAKLLEARVELSLAETERLRLMNGAAPETRQIYAATVQAATAVHESARRELARGLELQKRSAIADLDLNRLKDAVINSAAELALAKSRFQEIAAPARADDLALADARIRLAEARANTAQEQLNRCVLRAPIDGVILRINAEVGHVIREGVPLQLMTIADVSELRVRAHVEELDALAVTSGARTRIRTTGRDRQEWTGRVVRIAAELRPKKWRNHQPSEHLDLMVREVEIAIENHPPLPIGLPVEVAIEPAPAGDENRFTSGTSRERR